MNSKKVQPYFSETSRKRCPSCGAKVAFSKLYLKQNIKKSKFTPSTYSSRKIPEFMNNELVKCSKCNLIYATSTPKEHILLENYKNCEYISVVEDNFAANTYLNYLLKNKPDIQEKRFSSAIEIGSGSSSFLNKLSSYNFDTLIGIEPSEEAKSSKKNISKIIKVYNKYNPSNYKKNSFDLFCCFMTLEHILEPRETLNEAMRILRPGGTLALAMHNIDSSLNKILGKYSPVIDIEHLQLFSKKSIQKLLTMTKFSNIQIIDYKNTYPLNYWLNLLPLNALKLKNKDSNTLKNFISNITISIKAGNIFVIANKLSK